nr:hypothetical protein [uncultured Porphyromonas sp.]
MKQPARTPRRGTLATPQEVSPIPAVRYAHYLRAGRLATPTEV